jgi:hypothetical protein
MHVSSLIAQSLRLREHEIEFIRIAALLHDVGHTPFSHSVEFAFNMFPSAGKTFTHTKIAEERIRTDSQLREVLEKHHETFHATDLAALAIGRFKNNVFSRIVDGPIDADKIDYIFRDNYHCGFPVGFDIDNLAQILIGDKAAGQLKVKKEGRTFAEKLLIGRHHLITSIHHEQKNRLANYLLSLTLKEALDNAPNANEIRRAMFMSWGDADLLGFLRKYAKSFWPTLDGLIHGEEKFHELANYSFRILSPYSRYNASLLARKPSRLPTLSKHLQKGCNMDHIFIDLYRADPPDLPLWVGDISIVDTPLGSGLVDSSLSEVNVAVYGMEKLEARYFQLDHIVKAYRDLDPSLTETEATDEIRDLYTGDEVSYCLHHICEILLNDVTCELRGNGIFKPDIPLLLLLALDSAFGKVLNRYRVQMRSIGAFSHLLSECQKAIRGKLLDGAYEFPPDSLPAELELDLKSLSLFGLIYRISKARRYKEGFTAMYSLRVAGWGRGYFRHNLSTSPHARRILRTFDSMIEEKIRTQRREFLQFFELLERSRKSYAPNLEGRIDEIAKQLSLKVIK